MDVALMDAADDQAFAGLRQIWQRDPDALARILDDSVDIAHKVGYSPLVVLAQLGYSSVAHKALEWTEEEAGNG